MLKMVERTPKTNNNCLWLVVTHDFHLALYILIIFLTTNMSNPVRNSNKAIFILINNTSSIQWNYTTLNGHCYKITGNKPTF